MALTRSMLKGMGLTEEQVSAIIDAHTETVDGLKDSLKAAKADADKLKTVQKELDDLKANNGDDFKSKYEKEHSDFEDYKKTVASEKAAEEKRRLYRDLLKETGVGDKQLEAVLKVTDLSTLKVKDGALEDADKLKEAIQKEWAGFIATTTTSGAKVDTPPKSTHTAKTREEIYAKDEHGRYKLSTEERQRALAENPDLLKGA